MVLTEIALHQWQTNVSLVSKDCYFAVNFLVAFEANQGITFILYRYQYTDVNGLKLRITIVEYGIPQGSLLGPRLFEIHVNNLPESVDEGVICLFADDTTVYYVGNNIEDVSDGLNRIAEDLTQWSMKKKLCITLKRLRP